jgi:hypothetical protein
MTIALLVDAGLPENSFNDIARHTAIALTRVVAGRNHSLLLHADTGTVMPVLLAALEYQAPVGVEGGEVVTDRLVLLPLLRHGNVEEGLFHPFEAAEGEEGVEPPASNNLLELLSEIGGVDISHRDILPTEDEFYRLFNALHPSTIVALGTTADLESALAGAERYKQDTPNRQVTLYYMQEGGQREGGWGGWQPLDSLLRDAEIDVPPTLNGEMIEDGELLLIAREAETLTMLALASERVIE